MNIHQRRRAARAAVMAKAAEEAKKKAEAEAAEQGKKLTKTALNKMTKDELESMAREKFSIELDKRKTKAKLVQEILDAQ
jgi:glutamate mutase epsilon subunit|tara:strand:+ start:129 stop:368 length:240 start_codon:yes stop_codon:yes gene_type:complete